MRTKEDLKKIKGESGEQLEFVESITTAEKIHKKRLSIFIFLFLTVGLSLIFLLYREIKDRRFIVRLPQINLNLKKILPQRDPLSSILASDLNSWTLCLFDLKTSKLIYSRSCPPSSLPAVLPASPSSLLKSSLPNGLEIKENFLPSNSAFDFSATITSPTDRFLLTAKVFGSSSLSSSQILLPSVAEALYWRFSSP